MKKIIYLLPLMALAIALCSGCVNTKANDPVAYPSGTFTGKFRKLHRSLGSTVIDTVTANIQLTLEGQNGFKVLGDTTTVHAGSKGQYAINASQFIFVDSTFPVAGDKLKMHLHGVYDYSYDGNNVLQILARGDTIAVQYDLKKTP